MEYFCTPYCKPTAALTALLWPGTLSYCSPSKISQFLAKKNTSLKIMVGVNQTLFLPNPYLLGRIFWHTGGKQWSLISSTRETKTTRYCTAMKSNLKYELYRHLFAWKKLCCSKWATTLLWSKFKSLKTSSHKLSSKVFTTSSIPTHKSCHLLNIIT